MSFVIFHIILVPIGPEVFLGSKVGVLKGREGEGEEDMWEEEKVRGRGKGEEVGQTRFRF